MHAPLFTVVTLITLAAGIGANTAIFSVIRNVLLKPLPFDEPDRLVGVWHKAPGLGFQMLNASPSTYYTYKEEGKVFESVGLWNGESVTVTGLAEPERIGALRVTSEILPMLRVQPFLGRSFSAKDDSPGAPETVILTYGYWQHRFGGDTSVLGRRVLIDGKAHDIIGVMPQRFKFLGEDSSVLLPFQFNRAEVFVGNFSYRSVARLKPGATIAQANADVARMLPMMVNKFKMPPGFSRQMLEDAKLGPNLHPFHEDLVGDIGKVLWVLMGTVGIVLLIACANVANLFLVRAEGRQQELAIRSALGASWGRLAKELLTESVMLGVLGGALGLVLAWAGIKLLVYLEPASIPRLSEIAIDLPTLGFTALISVLAGVLFGLIPVFKYKNVQLGAALKEGGRGSSEGRERHRARAILAVVQVALALVLLVSSGLMIRTFQALRSVQPGFTKPAEVMTMRLSIPDAVVKDPIQSVRVHEQIIHKIEELPGVQSVALTSSITMDGWDSNDPVFVEDHPLPEGQMPKIRRMKWLGPGVFKTMGNPLLAGRDFTWEDGYSLKPVLMVSENFARAQWGSPAAAVGKRVKERPDAKWCEVIGVVANEHDDGVDKPAPEIVYWPILQEDHWGEKVSARRNLAYVIRSPRTGSGEFMNEIRRAVWSVNSSLPLSRVRTLEKIHAESMARTSFTLVMLAIAAGVALLLGVVGIYGVIAYSVVQRTREIGIRMALGARREDVTQMFVKHGLTLTAIGVASGLAAAIALTRVMSSLLYGVNALDPVTYLGVAVGLMGATLVASYLPARRATVIDPVRALRGE